MQVALSIQDLECILATFEEYCVFVTKKHKENLLGFTLSQTVGLLLCGTACILYWP